MTHIPIRLVIVGTIASVFADVWFAAVAFVDRVLARAPFGWRWEK